MYVRKARRRAPEVNAGSMADIAFLLLIFFLVTTTILSDEGIFVLLPPWESESPELDIHTRNLIKVQLNSAGALLFCGEEIDVSNLRKRTKQRLTNQEMRPDWPERGNKALVMLLNDRSTAYSDYLEVYNELKGAYQELWDQEAEGYSRRPYAQLSKAEQRAIRSIYPMVISEAEPTDHP